MVLGPCIQSLLQSEYSVDQIILVDDGSSDTTFEIMHSWALKSEKIVALRKSNGGKASALNLGIAQARGSVIICCDADGNFSPNTVGNIVSPFADPRVGAVCGDDRTLNTNVVQTKFLALISHVGTGLTRRALHMLRCLPIVSGNIGAFSRSALEHAGPFYEELLGEDLKMTWRIHKSGFWVALEPTAIVYAETPSTVRGLWKQRVRWARGFIQTAVLHRSMIGSPEYGTFGIGLVYFVISATLVPLAQFLTLPAFIAALFAPHHDMTVWEVWWAAGLTISVFMLAVAIMLNRAFRDLRFIWLLPLWPVYSTFMGAAFVWACVLELRRSPRRWNKLERSGVRSVQVTALQELSP